MSKPLVHSDEQRLATPAVLCLSHPSSYSTADLQRLHDACLAWKNDAGEELATRSLKLLTWKLHRETQP